MGLPERLDKEHRREDAINAVEKGEAFLEAFANLLEYSRKKYIHDIAVVGEIIRDIKNEFKLD